MRNYLRRRYGARPVSFHIWPDVLVDDRLYILRVTHLKAINSRARFISFEPLLGPSGEVDLTGIA